MRRALSLLLAAALLTTISGCRDRVDLENVTLMLMMGLDLDENNKLVIYASSPVFSKEAKEKNEVTQVNAETLRDSRGKLEARVSALISTGKLQNILVGKKLLQHPGWIKLLDLFYRDSKTRINARLIAVDGPVGEIMYFAPANKRRLSLHIAKLVDTANERNLVEKATLFEFNRQLLERGKMPIITGLRKTKREVVADESILLDNSGMYVGSLDLEENEILQILQDDQISDLSLTFLLPEQGANKDKALNLGALSCYVVDVKRKVRTGYSDGRFRFDLDFRLPIRLTERLFSFDVQKDTAQLEKQIDKQLQAQMKAVVDKLQKHAVDPIGLGLFARAYRYRDWKKVQDQWGEAFKNADIRIRVRTEIIDMGEIR
ncbi:Ger(x)C family spore germination protein [Paenibacillus sacheonensis]|uniref:Ger(X)C family spore germination protein n=1 Tax=Paenibacillus sacheonensis TaxID=742054 RepID=A0A7X4YKV2_9BACL|nr:Ger(x)C family spore germination protein [Paenibacillus sacheonensis]MBM7563191.1 Ger(x)C family germination protein [Paenibacillus sacheonensis]NBC68246.1 Ger(x)C family spore germination protein [Paenibacillus sacheonensis]